MVNAGRPVDAVRLRARSVRQREPGRRIHGAERPRRRLKGLDRGPRCVRLRFDRRAVLVGLVIGIVGLAAILGWISILGGIPGAIVLVFPSFFLWLLIFVWVARRTMPPGRPPGSS